MGPSKLCLPERNAPNARVSIRARSLCNTAKSTDKGGYAATRPVGMRFMQVWAVYGLSGPVRCSGARAFLCLVVLQTREYDNNTENAGGSLSHGN